MHYLTPHIRVTEWASRVAAHPTRGPGKGPRKRWEEKWSGAKAGHQGPGELAGSVWYRPRRLLPRVRGAFQSREPRGCYALTRCTYPAWVVPSAGARVPGIRHGAVQTVPPPCESAAPPVRPEPPRSAPRRPAGDAARRHPPRSPRATPRAARSLLPPCCVSAAWDPRSGDDPGPQTSLH